MGIFFKDQVNAMALAYLQRCHGELQEQKSQNVASSFNGCRERAIRLRSDLQSVGVNCVVIRVISVDSLTHESNALFHYHDVVLDDAHMVYDPNYTGRVPVHLQNYVQTAYFLPKNVDIWKLGENPTRIANYANGLHFEHPPF